MGTNPTIFAAVLHYGTRPDGGTVELLTETLDSLRAMDAPGMTLAVVDNGSTDGSIEIAERLFHAREHVPHLGTIAVRNEQLDVVANERL